MNRADVEVLLANTINSLSLESVKFKDIEVLQNYNMLLEMAFESDIDTLDYELMNCHIKKLEKLKSLHIKEYTNWINRDVIGARQMLKVINSVNNILGSIKAFKLIYNDTEGYDMEVADFVSVIADFIDLLTEDKQVN